MKLGILLDLAADEGFHAAFCMDARIAPDAPAFVRSLLLLIRAYVPWEGAVDAFYIADNAAYHAARRIVNRLNSEKTTAVLLPKIRLKPLCDQLPPFASGRNTLHYLTPYGSRFCMQLIGLQDETERNVTPRAHGQLICGSCRKCIADCPTGALSSDGFCRGKCLRNHMLSGKPTPAELRSRMGVRLLGCDLCQRACPHNAGLTAAENSFPIELDHYLPPDDETLTVFSNAVGANYANRNRLCAQALLAAANGGQRQLLHKIDALRTHPSEAVRVHANWAYEMLQLSEK